MLSDVRNRICPAEYRMELKRPDGVAYASLGYIDGILGRSFAFAWDAYDELNLEISKYVMQGHKRKKNPYWDLCRGDYIIEVSREPEEDEADRQRFIIAQVNTKIDDKDVKEIQAYSLEYEFVSKNLRDYTSMLDAEIDKPRKLVTKNENEPGILEDLLVRKMGCNWKEGKITGGWTLAYGDGRDGVGRLDEDVLEKARTFSFSEGTVYEFLTELQKSFRCIFQFDTMKKEISIYDITVYNTCPVCGESHYLYYDQGTLRCGNERYIPEKETQETSCTFVKAIYGRDSGLYMTEQNYIKTFGENIDHSQITTRLYAYGKDDISIQDADNNPAGKPYLEDFSYFRSREYMSQELLDALDGYETYLQEMQDPDIEKGDKSTIFQALLEQKKGQQKKLHDLRYGTVSKTDLRETLELMQKAVERTRELFDKLMEELGVTVGSEADRKQREENLKAYREKIDEEFGVFDDKFIKGLFLKADGTGFESEEDLSRLDFENIKIDVEKFGYDALLELQKVYEARISALVEMANTVRENAEGETYLDFNVWQKENSNQELTDFSPELSLTERWKKGSRFLFAGVKKGSGSLGEVQVPSISQKEENWTTKKFDNYVATTYEVELLEDKNVVTWSGNGAGLKQIVPPGETAQPFEPEGDREISVELNGQPLIADYHYTLDRAKKTITRRGTNLYPVKDKIDKAVQEMENQVTAAEEKVDWYAKKLEELNQKVSYEYYLGTLIETAQDEETRQRLRELPEEMNKFIKESVYTNTDIGVPDLTEAMGTNEYREAAGQLYTDAKNAFAVMWQPPVQFEIDIVNLWKIVSCQDDWNKLSLGDMVHIRHRDAAKKDYVVRVVGIDYDPDQNTLRVKFTNQDNLKTPDALVKELFKRTKTTNAALSLHQEQWNNAQNNAVEQILNHEWDAATQAVKAGDHQTVVIDNRGITVSSEQASLEGHEMRLMSGLLAFTDDGWQTSRTAISNGHVAAENVVGKLLAGKNLEIIANKTDRPSVQTFRVDGNGVYLSNGALTVEGPRDKNGKPLQDGNGIELTPEKGLVVTNQGNGFELCMNAAVGLYFKANAKQSYNPVGMSNPSS
ncbi:MAG: DUF4200 domain-containing protein, partial [Clostridia bacterium]|nr:DUF4200 domain-containing protein [Clostridia bacterium]